MSKPIDARSVTITKQGKKYIVKAEEWFGDDHVIRGVKLRIRFYVEVYDYGDRDLDLVKEIIADEILLEKPEEE